MISILLILSLIISGCIGPKSRPQQPTGALPCIPLPVTFSKAAYLILAPKNLFTGSEASIAMSAFSDDKRVSRCIELSIKGKDGNTTTLTRNLTGNRTAAVSFYMPALKEGSYTLAARDTETGETLEAQVQVIEGNALFLETDKPIYKPGQTVHGRVLVLNNGLKPVKQEVLVEITDAKGIKIFKKKLGTGEFGVASFDLPLALELNLGTWKVTAESGSSRTSVDIRVEKYVLPKFRINMTMPKDWYLADEKISGSVDARYFFGKPVDGVTEIEASRYIGVWQTYATFSANLKDGATGFVIPEVGYAAGTYGAGGQGSIMLNISIKDTGNHTERLTKMVTVAGSPFVIKLIPDSNAIKPGLPFQLLVVTSTPDGKPLDKKVAIRVVFRDRDYRQSTENIEVDTAGGIALAELKTPDNATGVYIEASSDKVYGSVDLSAVYSPGASYIHIVQAGKGTLKAGEKAEFRVYSSRPGTVYYDVFARDRTVFSGTTDSGRINFQITPQMGKTAKLVAYMINPDSEVSADSLPFDIEFVSPVKLDASFDKEQAAPGDAVRLSLNAGTRSMIGISIVDESVYALSEGRLNLRQVFDELELRFMEPKAEAHPSQRDYRTKGAYDILSESGLQMIASPKFTVPKGERMGTEQRFGGLGRIFSKGAAVADINIASVETPPSAAADAPPLAKVERIRQFFPETWVWEPELITDSDGRIQLDLTVPDTITSWKIHAVSSSDQGFGIAESNLRVFQEFFIEPDLPYAVTRGEEFPVQIQVYNYLDTSQTVYIELAGADWFDALGSNISKIDIDAGSVSSVNFFIRPAKVGMHEIKITARSPSKADAVVKEIIVEPEGSAFENVNNGILNSTVKLDTSLPDGIVPDSGKVMLSLTPSIVAQTISGVDNLLNMPYGCGEQNMILFAPDVEVLRYLKSTGQVNPEIRAKAEMFITTGYQRELTYQREDGSFSAFGNSDREGSLWLSAFVLSSFSGARDVTAIDENVLSRTAKWITDHQNQDGSWDAVGFVHHQDMMGGVSGRFTLTAYTALALSEYGKESESVNRAALYLENNLADAKDPYSLAVSALALKKLGSPKANEALNALMALAKYDTNGMYWGENPVRPMAGANKIQMEYIPGSSKNVEITAYAALALMEARDGRANDALKWISAQRNSKGGFSSTQDTVMAFRALITAAVSAGRDIDADVSVSVDGRSIKEFRLSHENYDVLQLVEIPQDAKTLTVKLTGKGDVSYQLVKKYNVILEKTPVKSDLELNVTYDAKKIEVNDIVNVSVSVRFNGEAASTGMLLIDVAVPTGFSPVVESLDGLKSNGIISRYEIGGRKIILYVDDLPAGKELEFGLKVKAMFPVKAVIPDSRAYSYYNPEIKSENKGGEIKVAAA